MVVDSEKKKKALTMTTVPTVSLLKASALVIICSLYDDVPLFKALYYIHLKKNQEPSLMRRDPFPLNNTWTIDIYLHIPNSLSLPPTRAP